MEKHLKNLHKSVGVNELQPYFWDTSLKIMIQCRLYMRMKGTDHNIMINKFMQRFEEEKLKNNEEFLKNFNYSDPNNVTFKLHIKFLNKISKKCVETFEQLGSNINEKEIIY